MIIDRRVLLTGLVAAFALPASAQEAVQGFSAVAVDVEPLRAKGLGSYADAVGTALRAELADAFRDRIRPGGPRLSVVVTGVSLQAYAGGEGRYFRGGAPSDYLEGEALVLGRRGEVLARHPQLSALPASSGGAWYLPDNEQRRLAALCRHYAGWLRRSIRPCQTENRSLPKRDAGKWDQARRRPHASATSQGVPASPRNTGAPGPLAPDGPPHLIS